MTGAPSSSRAGQARALAAAVLILAGLARPDPARARVELGAPASKADVTIGCMFPMSGRSAIYGRDSVGGIRVALERLAGQAGTGRKPRLRILVDDDRSKASHAIQLAENYLRRDGARFLCGVVSSGVAQAVTRLASSRDVIFIGTDHASSRLTIENFHRRYFRVSNDTFSSMAAGARYLSDLRKKQPWKRIAFVGADYDYGHVSLQDLRASLDRLNVKYDLVATLWPKLYEPDYAEVIHALQASQPDVVVAALWGADFLAFLRQAAATDLLESARLANFDTGGNYDVMEALGSSPPPGLILSARHHNNWPETPLNRWFVETFHQLEGRYPTYAAEGAYGGIMAIAAAVERAGPRATTEQLVRALEGLRLELPEDPAGFASYIDPETHQIAQVQAIGEVVPDTRFPPAKVMLGRWVWYQAEDLQVPPELLRKRRERAHVRALGVE